MRASTNAALFISTLSASLLSIDLPRRHHAAKVVSTLTISSIGVTGCQWKGIVPQEQSPSHKLSLVVKKKWPHQYIIEAAYGS